MLTPDGSQILYGQTTRQQPDELLVYEFASGNRRTLGNAGKDICVPCLGDARFSPDGRWTAMVRTDNKSALYGSGIMAAPFRNGVLLQAEAAVTARAADGIPAWSPDGNLLYFRSGRDSQACIWAQRLATSTKTPLSKPFLVQHPHEPEFAPTLSPAVAGDRLVVERSRRNGNIWLTRLD